MADLSNRGRFSLAVTSSAMTRFNASFSGIVVVWGWIWRVFSHVCSAVSVDVSFWNPFSLTK